MGVDVREPGEARAGGLELNREILDAFGALVKLDGVVTMKELAHRMGCDASFITSVADAQEDAEQPAAGR